MRFAGLILMFALSGFAAAPLGNISSLIGTAQVYSVQRNVWKPAKMGQALYANDTLRTGAESRLEVKSVNGGFIRIDENSLIILAPAKDGQKVTLAGGKVWANMRKIVGTQRKFEVYTPTATASIRGTVFRVNAGTDSATDVLVYQGKVDVGPGDALRDKNEQSKAERQEVDGPVEVSGPTEVSLEDWVSIVAGQQISVQKDGSYEKSKFDQAVDARQSWVKYNQERDSSEQ